MTVSELIEQLKNYPADMRVLVPGYEGGLDDINVRRDSVVFDVNDKKNWYIGNHEYADPAGDDEGTECVIIGSDYW